MKVLTYFAGVAIAIGAAGCKKETNPNTGQPKTPGEQVGGAVGGAVDTTTREASKAKDAIVSHVAPSGSADLSGIRGALEGVVENALGKNDFKSMTSHFTAADEQRLNAAQPDQQLLNASIDKFKEAWKAKYKDNFAVMDKDKIYADDFATLAAGDTSNGPKAGTATLKGSGSSDLKVPLISEGGKWRVDVPDDVDAGKLMQNLQKATDELNGNNAQWPSDKTQAYRVVSRRILAAVLNQTTP